MLVMEYSKCRVCLDEGNINIFTAVSGQELTISNRLAACSTLSVNSDDGFPSNICYSCLSELDIAYKFRQKCTESEAKLRQSLQHPIQTVANTLWCDNLRPDNGDERSIPNIFTPVKPEIKSEMTEDTIRTILKRKRSNKIKSKHEKSNKNENSVKQKANLFRSVKKYIPEKLNEETVENEIGPSKNILLENSDLSNAKVESFKNDWGKCTDRDKNRNHMCTICGKTFLYSGNLLDHERVHSGDKPYNCQICNRRFSQTGHLSVHQRTHSGIKPYQCEICSRAFSVSHALKKHLRTHTGERPYACTMCSKSFVTSYHLSNHFKRHTGEKEFKCDFPDCQHGFVNISEMKRHRVRHDKAKDMTKPKFVNFKNTHERYQTMSVIDLQNFASKVLPDNIKTNNEFRKYLDSIFHHTENDIQ